MNLPPSFRRMSVLEKRDYLVKNRLARPQLAGSDDQEYLWLCDVMIENAVGFAGIPLGLTSPLKIDEKDYLIPMATEEPSVIAAASFAGSIISHNGGFTTKPPDSLITGHLYFSALSGSAAGIVKKALPEAIRESAILLASMEKRGGGLDSWEFFFLEKPSSHILQIVLNVCDAMGANLMNSYLEKLSEVISRLTGVQANIAILSNNGNDRVGSAQFTIPLGEIKRAGRYNMPAEEIAESIVFLSDLAEHFQPRAVTHNKGIMNGITALALATGNDTRAVEASAHSYAAFSGAYKGLTSYSIVNRSLVGQITMPITLATRGGSIGFTDYSRFSLDILGDPEAKQLCSIALALGLAQNFAALLALATKGIQAGHMRLHAKKIAFQAGARGRTIHTLADLLNKEKNYSLSFAQKLLLTVQKHEQNRN